MASSFVRTFRRMGDITKQRAAVDLVAHLGLELEGREFCDHFQRICAQMVESRKMSLTHVNPDAELHIHMAIKGEFRTHARTEGKEG